MIWSLSRFYNTPERLVGLLRKLSNEIINRCCSVISLPDIFNGEVENVIVALEQVFWLSALPTTCRHQARLSSMCIPSS